MTSKAEQNDPIVARGSASLNRRHFLRGLGACVAVPAFASLRPARVLAGGLADQTPGGYRSGRSAPRSLRLFP